MTDLLWQLAETFASLSLVAIGGITVLLPEIERQVVHVHGWMSAAAFTSTFAIANAAPGPNLIVLSLIGWQVAGVAGLLVATLAILLPSSALAWLAARMLARWSDSSAVAIVKSAWIPLALGLMLASGASMMRAIDRDVVTVVISLGTAAFVVLSRRNPLWALATGTVANILALHLLPV